MKAVKQAPAFFVVTVLLHANCDMPEYHVVISSSSLFVYQSDSGWRLD
jgi:hypothetical protein